MAIETNFDCRRDCTEFDCGLDIQVRLLYDELRTADIPLEESVRSNFKALYLGCLKIREESQTIGHTALDIDKTA